MSDAEGSRNLRGPLLVLAAAVLWSAGGVGIKSLPLSPMAITGWRSLFAIPLLLAARGARVHPRRLLERPHLLRIAASYAATLSLFVAATKLTTAANAILLQYTSPFWVLLLAPLLARKSADRVRGRDLLLGAGCFLGLCLFFLDQLSAEGRLGIVLAILSGIAMSIMTIDLRQVGRGERSEEAFGGILWGNVLASLVCLPWMAAGARAAGPLHWGILVWLGLFQIAAPYLLFSTGVRTVPALRATLIAMLEPILNPVWVLLVWREVPQRGAILGGTVILVCILVDAVIHRPPDGEAIPPGGYE
jgi:drug/metabolite transporter, DME family